MNCPVCKTTLQVSDRQGIEIDYCPQCRGVWLDRGELDKIIEKSAAFETRNPASDPFYEHKERPDYRPDNYGKQNPYYGQKRKKGFLGDLFDFD